MKQDFVIVCESAIVDKQTNNLYILGIFENINAPNLPAIHPKISVVTKFSGGNGEHNHRIIIRHENGDKLVEFPGKINFGSTGQAQYIGSLIGLPFKQYGKHIIEIYVDNILQPMVGTINITKPVNI